MTIDHFLDQRQAQAHPVCSAAGVKLLESREDSLPRVGIESDAGFELGLEMVAKARRARRPVAEIATIWLDRDHGASNFKLWQWLPTYLRWYGYAFFGRRT